jgi:hypothetical protein
LAAKNENNWQIQISQAEKTRGEQAEAAGGSNQARKRGGLMLNFEGRVEVILQYYNFQEQPSHSAADQ